MSHINRIQVTILNHYWHIVISLLLAGNAIILLISHPLLGATNIPLYIYDIFVAILMLIGAVGMSSKCAWAVKVALLSA